MVRSALDSMKLLSDSEEGSGLRKRTSEARLTDRQALFARSSKAWVRAGRSGSWMLAVAIPGTDGPGIRRVPNAAHGLVGGPVKYQMVDFN